MKNILDIIIAILAIIIFFMVINAIDHSFQDKQDNVYDTDYTIGPEPFELSDTLNQLHLPNQLNEEFFNGIHLYISTDNYDLTVDFKSGNAIINFTKENTLK